MKTSTKLNIHASIAVAVSLPAMMLYELMPGATVMESLWFICRAFGAWVAVALVVFAMNWVFFGTLYLFGRWIYASFYRTPTL